MGASYMREPLSINLMVPLFNLSFSSFTETSNDLANEIGGYENIAVLRGVSTVNMDLFGIFQKLPRGTAASDCIL